MSTRYLTVDELKLYVRSELAVDDAFYEAAINTAETIIDNTTGRRFDVASPTVSSARSYIPSGGCIQFIHDCVSIVSVVDNSATLISGTDYQAEPLNGLSDIGASVPYYALRRLGYYYRKWFNWYGIPGAPTIVVTARWGWPAIPPEIREACKIVAKDVFLQRDVAHGLIGVSDVGGIGARLNPQVRDTLYSYAHPSSIVVG